MGLGWISNLQSREMVATQLPVVVEAHGHPPQQRGIELFSSIIRLRWKLNQKPRRSGQNNAAVGLAKEIMHLTQEDAFDTWYPPLLGIMIDYG